jgi:hypothetical protein
LRKSLLEYKEHNKSFASLSEETVERYYALLVEDAKWDIETDPDKIKTFNDLKGEII